MLLNEKSKNLKHNVKLIILTEYYMNTDIINNIKILKSNDLIFTMSINNRIANYIIQRA